MPTDPAPLTEPEDAGDEDGIDADLLELHEVLEMQAALDAEEGGS